MHLGLGELWMEAGLRMKFRLLEDAGRRESGPGSGWGLGGGRGSGDISE